MKLGKGWSRRRFLAVSGATAAQAAVGLKGLGQAAGSAADAVAVQQRNAAEAARTMPPPGVITGGIQPLMKDMTARPLRYRPVAGEFVIRNGGEFFNRPIYGVSSPTQAGDFRVDAGDLPEFSLYLPGHGGNLKIGIIGVDGVKSKWGATADEVVARYRPGRMIYEIRDGLLGKGVLYAELLTAGEGEGLMLKVEGRGVPDGTRLAWAFAGVSGRKGQRNGDIGCERQPVSQFFQVRPEECDGNVFTLPGSVAGTQVAAHVKSTAAELVLGFPAGSSMGIAPFAAWASPPAVANKEVSAEAAKQPVLAGSAALKNGSQYITLNRILADAPSQVRLSEEELAKAFAARSAHVEAIAGTLKAETPDEYVNAAVGAIGIAAETIWDQKQECVMHGGVAWRTALAGWRGPYNLDALGNHDRAVLELRHWLKRQNVTPVTTADPATGPWDANIHLARKEKLLHSNGDLSNNHYDMNMVFMDVLLRHLMWTGDLEFAREVWPALQRHLAWEHRLFRRTYKGADGKELPLYEAYAAIWASDNLQYNGGGAAHSSAYNVFAFRTAAKIAKALGEDGSEYEAEAELIHRGMQELLWVKEQGAFGESKDLLGPQTVYTNPALWTVYHTIDSQVPTPRQAWQMAAERLAVLKHVPVHGDGVPEGGYMLSCSDWLPYMWSLNLLLLGENMHMALAMWQAGMRDEAYGIFKGNLLDSMYMGLCPGDFHMTSALDVHRQEAQRDFGDPIGISSRAIVEGLFGVQPDLLAGEIRIRPGFPSDWERASLKHKDFDFAWKREGMRETIEFTSRLAKAVPLTVMLPARTTSLPVVTHNGKRITGEFDAAAVGSPMLALKLPAAQSNRVSIEWHGKAPSAAPAMRSYRVGETLQPIGGAWPGYLDDPQGALSAGRAVAASGFHTLFATIKEGDATWSMPISFTGVAEKPAFAAVPAMPADRMGEQLNLSPLLKHNITEIFTRVYAEPRSPYCSLAFPDNLLGGWANADGRATIDDAGLRAAGGLLKTGIGVDFATPAGTAPNCLFFSYWKQDTNTTKVPLSGRAHGVYLLMAGSTLPQCSRMQHGTVSVTYSDGTSAKLALRNPETWWPIEQDYLLDDYLFVNDAPLPPRMNLRTGQTRILDPVAFHGKGRTVPGGAATILHLPLDPVKELASLQVEVELYGIVVALMAATLARV
ncbi:MAG TPA: DUF4450 domain-containing protein [Acidobacteriaceae bacterium]|jgi:hypothetical protein